MSDLAKTYKTKDNKILRIYYDSNFDYDNENEDIFLVYEHGSFTRKVEGFEPKHIYHYLNQLPEVEERDISFDDYHIWTVYAYIHGGVSLSLSRGSDRWDTSSTGFILAKKSSFIADKDKVKEVAESLIKEWNNILNGDVYGFKLFSFKTCETCGHVDEVEEDSCWGFIGTDFRDLFENVCVKKEELTEIDEDYD